MSFQFHRYEPFPLRPRYMVGENGRVFSTLKGCFLKPHIGRDGYHKVALWDGVKQKTFYVHQAVALTFYGPRPSSRHHAAHRNGDKNENSRANVQWITKEQNEADKIVHGRTNRGERNGQAKLTDAQVEHVRALVASGRSQASVAVQFGLTQSGVSRIVTNRRRANG